MGSHLVAELLCAGCTVRMLVRDIKRQQLLHRTLERMGVSSFYDRIEFRETALNNPYALREAVEGTDVLFHCAAQVSFDPERSDEIIVANTELATHVVNACLDSGVGLLVHVSSVATLGPARPGRSWSMKRAYRTVWSDCRPIRSVSSMRKISSGGAPCRGCGRLSSIRRSLSAKGTGNREVPS